MGIQTPNGFNLDNSGKRIVVDPVTRIEGHLRVEVNVDSNNVIRNAVSTGTMWRGIEVILRGRDPRDAWAFTERICGVCTGTHALTSVRAVEDALAIKIPENANSIRNIMQLTLQVHDHIVHFYHLHALDWVDVVSALSADPKATSALAQSISPWPLSSPGYFKDLQTPTEEVRRIAASSARSRTAIGARKAYKLPPEANLMAVAHYLEALDFQKEIVKIHTIFGGKNPHPNWLVGGVPCPINVDGVGGVGAINMERLNYVTEIIDRSIEFTDQVYLPDVAAIGSFYKDWLYGGGLSGKSVLAYGDIPEHANDYSGEEPAAAAGRDHQRQSRRGFPGRSPRPGGDPGIRHPQLVQISRRDQGPAPLGRRHRAAITCSAPTPRAPRPISRASTRAANIPGSSRRAGRAMRWRSARSPAGSSAMRRASRSSRSRSTSC